MAHWKQEEMIAVDPFREALDKWRKEKEYTWADVAKALGWMHYVIHKGKRYNAGDSTRLKRVLGIVYYTSHGKLYKKETIQYKTAVLIVELIGRDPVEFGI